MRKLKPEEFSSEIKIGDVKLNPVLLQNLQNKQLHNNIFQRISHQAADLLSQVKDCNPTSSQKKRSADLLQLTSETEDQEPQVFIWVTADVDTWGFYLFNSPGEVDWTLTCSCAGFSSTVMVSPNSWLIKVLSTSELFSDWDRSLSRRNFSERSAVEPVFFALELEDFGTDSCTGLIYFCSELAGELLCAL